MLLNKKEAEIIGEFSSDYHKKVYGRDIARKLNLNQKTVANILNNLEEKDILKFTQEGRNKYYFLNTFNTHMKEIIKIIEINRKLKFLNKNKKLRDLFGKLEQRTKGLLIVFGSYASGTQTKNSDLDLFVVDQISEIDDLEELYKVKINIVKSSKNKFNEKETIIKEIIKNHIILKGIEDSVELIW
tara:strand:+ start:11077 stop:11634 length:558 start_codon:yes stop_codon:yes gene_type:complete